MFVSGRSSTRFVIVLIIIIFLNSPAALTQSDPPPILVTKLVHYLSVDSPFYDDYFSNKSARDISLFDLHTSIARASHITNPNNNHSTLFEDKNAIETRLTARPTGGFLVHIKVGSKSLDQFVYMDTGSGLLWINCEPCGQNVPYPIFYPPDSTTFRKENCSLGFCPATGIVNVECKDNGTCSYTARYAGGDFSLGYLARDSITFQGSDEILQEVAFGCARATSGLKVNGMLGLSNNPISLISQMQVSKFGYCIGNISDSKYPYHMLTIGDEIELLGKQTTLIIQDKYYVTLEGIKFDGIPLDINASIFERNVYDYTGGMVVDTGSTYTFLPRAVVDKIEDKIMGVIGGSLPLNDNDEFIYKDYMMLCYDGILTRDIHRRRRFPIVTFKFKGDNAEMVLTYENMFRQMDDRTFCSVVIPSENLNNATFSILGSIMQQYYFNSYDLSKKLFAFWRMDCAFIQDPYH